MMTDEFKQQNSEWVSFNTELTRKLEQQIERWVKNHTEGKITDRELFVAVSALWDTCAGLVQEGPLRMLEQIHTELRLAMKAKAKK